MYFFIVTVLVYSQVFFRENNCEIESKKLFLSVFSSPPRIISRHALNVRKTQRRHRQQWKQCHLYSVDVTGSSLFPRPPGLLDCTPMLPLYSPLNRHYVGCMTADMQTVGDDRLFLFQRAERNLSLRSTVRHFVSMSVCVAITAKRLDRLS